MLDMRMESCWDAFEPDPWMPDEAGPLVVVSPHPDDETLGAGGLIYTWARRRLPVTVVCVTDGEAACPEVAGLAAIRQEEFRRALHCLGADAARVVRLRLPDGRAREGYELLEEALSFLISGSASGDTMLVAPFEADGHPDHDIAGLVATEVGHRHGVAVAGYPIWAWDHGTPAIFAARHVVGFSLSPAAREAKRRAIQCYVSQLRDRPGGPIVPAHLLAHCNGARETFVLMEPRR